MTIHQKEDAKAKSYLACIDRANENHLESFKLRNLSKNNLQRSIMLYQKNKI